ncbi:MAG TPA: PepSY-associated TM helix domain-containing protein [Steroidobacteraceae bacterium]|nr:PepSY-associated TM helix domain-containing protein [Steroidobacteraceae bacterium]
MWFQLHWFVGITAGIILGIAGLTGAMLSFENQIVTALNDGVYLRAPRGADRDDPRVVAAEAQTGKTFFKEVRKLHRWLMLGEFGNRDVGRKIVGACTTLLIFMAGTGLYLRWPRGSSRWRNVLLPKLHLRGRALLWNLHATIGLWCLLIYLLIALTGITWSYAWYRESLMSLFGGDIRRLFLPLHSGQFFGMPGMIVFMLASVCMPLFAITGWLLYLQRRNQRAARAAQGEPQAPELGSNRVR